MNILIALGILVVILPALLVALSLAGKAPTDGNTLLEAWSSRRGVLLALAAAILLSLPLALQFRELFTDWLGLISLLLLPALVGVLALLILRWRAVLAVWRSDRLLLTVMLATLAILVTLPVRSQPVFTPILLLGSLLVALVWAVARRMRGGMMVFGIFCLLLLVLDASGLASSPSLFYDYNLRAVYALGSVILPFLSLAAAAWLVYGGLYEESRSRRIACLALAGLVFSGLCASVLRFGVLVNATGHAYEDRLPFMTIAAAVIVGLLLVLADGKRARAAGLAFIFFAPAALIAAYSCGWLVDAHAITAQRSARIVGAIQEYRQENGAYPHSLDYLSPQYLPFPVSPLNGRGTRWCYQGGADYYRLGYVFYQRYYHSTFPDPYSEIKVLSAAGQAPQGDWICDEELERMRSNGGL